MNYFNTAYNAGAVRRWHTVRTIQQQTVADHSWGVAMVLLQITSPSAELLKAAALHDLAETKTGDVPAPIKWAYPKLEAALQEVEADFEETNGIETFLSPDEAAMLKWADMMELILFCVSELRMGNKTMMPIYKRGIAYLRAKAFPTEPARQLFMRTIENGFSDQE